MIRTFFFVAFATLFTTISYASADEFKFASPFAVSKYEQKLVKRADSRYENFVSTYGKSREDLSDDIEKCIGTVSTLRQTFGNMYLRGVHVLNIKMNTVEFTAEQKRDALLALGVSADCVFRISYFPSAEEEEVHLLLRTGTKDYIVTNSDESFRSWDQLRHPKINEAWKYTHMGKTFDTMVQIMNRELLGS